MSQSGFTLIELMIVVGVSGLLATFAIPAFDTCMTHDKLVQIAHGRVKAGWYLPTHRADAGGPYSDAAGHLAFTHIIDPSNTRRGNSTTCRITRKGDTC